MYGDPPAPYLWLVLVVLNMLSGIFSGLNLGLMSLTEDDLKLLIESYPEGDRRRRDAELILPVRKRGNLLLCTLLIGNTLVNVMLSITTASLWTYLFGVGTLGNVFALVLPTCLIVIFGEIVPQSACSRYALRVGAVTLPLTYVFLVVCFVVAWPVSVILDKLLGDEPSQSFTRKSLLVLFQLNSADPEADITQDDLKILGGALKYMEHKVSQVMTPIESVFSLPDTAKLDKDTILEILKHGHTRIPIYHESRENIVGIFFCKDILGIDFNHTMPIQEVIATFQADKRIRRVSKDMMLNDAFTVCKRERVHLLIVTDDQVATTSGPARPTVGIITVEDIVEDIIQEELVDEDDEVVDAAKAKFSRSGTVLSNDTNTNTKAYDTGALLRELPVNSSPAINEASITLEGETVRTNQGSSMCCRSQQ